MRERTHGYAPRFGRVPTLVYRPDGDLPVGTPPGTNPPGTPPAPGGPPPSSPPAGDEEPINLAKAKELRHENQTLRDRAKKAEDAVKDVEALRARVEAFENEKLTEDQRKAKTLTDKETQLADAQRAASDLKEEVRQARLEAAVFRELLGNGTRLAQGAEKKIGDFVDRAAVTFDERNRPTNVTDTLANLFTELPFLLAPANGQTPPPAYQPQTRAPNPDRQQPGTTYTDAMLADPANWKDPVKSAEMLKQIARASKPSP